MSLPGLFDLHRELVECPSLSGGEDAIAAMVEGRLRSLPARVERIGNNVLARAGAGPSILLNSHLDTVPPAGPWTRPPHRLTVEGERRYGLGANDAKASVAAMMKTFERVAQEGGPAEVFLLLVSEEETGGGGMQAAWPAVQALGGAPGAAVVGEPTGLDVAVAQKGLLILELIAEGDGCHSANAAALGARNAIRILAADIVALEDPDLGEAHPSLGAATLQPTVLSGGERRNMLPASASCYLDVRTVPGLSSGEIVRRVESRVQSRVRVHSDRFPPRQTGLEEAVVRAALAARPGAAAYGSRTLSDWVYLDVPAVKMGPGRTERSHTPDEFVLASELEAGLAAYTALVNGYARLAAQEHR